MRYKTDQTCRFCENPESILTFETCCTGCSKLPIDYTKKGEDMFYPIGDRFLAQRMKEKPTGKLLLTADKPCYVCKILSCGTQHVQIQTGKLVMIAPYGYQEIELDGKKFLLLKEEQILGILLDDGRYENAEE